MSKQTINPGNSPIVWSTINEAFEKINSNFTELYLSIGGPGVDLTSISSSIIPDVDVARDLGSPSRRWRDLYLGPNSLYIGDAQISANEDGTVNLPAGSSIGGVLIRNPEESNFKTIRTAGQSDVVANDFQGVLNFTGSFISFSTNPATDTVTFINSGVTGITGSPAISVSSSTGNVTITNTGVTGLTAGDGINVSNSTGAVTISNTGILNLVTDPGSGITLNTVSPGIYNIVNSAPNVNQDVFKFIDLGPDRLEPNSPNTILNLSEGSGIDITINNITKTLSIANTGVTGISVGSGLVASSGSGNVTLSLSSPIINSFEGDLKGSVFADDSAIMVDATSNRLYAGNGIFGAIYATTLRTAESKISLGNAAGETNQGASAVAIGPSAGQNNQGTSGVSIGALSGQSNQGVQSVAVGPSSGNSGQGLQSVAVGNLAGSLNQGQRAVAIGSLAGSSGQGDYAVALGNFAGGNNQPANSIVINASGVQLDGSAAGFFVDPVRSTTSAARPVVYNSTTKEFLYTSTLEFINSTISTNDSSGLTIDVQTTFNTDVVFENDLTINNILLVRGQKVILLNDLQSLVAASTDFADFRARIAALI